MKKRLGLLITALILCIASVFAFSGCFDNIESEGTWDATADTKADSIKLLDAFFEDTLKDPNFVVTLKSGEEVQFTENVKGTASSLFAKDGSKIYAFIEDGIYYYVSESKMENLEGEETDFFLYCCSDESDERGYSEDAKSYYDNNYCNFMSYVKVVELIPANGGTFTCESHVEEKNGNSTGTLTFDFIADNGTINITANAKDGKVEKVTVVEDDKVNAEQSRTYTITFEYGSAVFEKPDIAARIREEEEKEARINANYQAIEDRDDFFFYYMEDDNMIATLTVGETVIFVETIANDIDCLDNGYFKVYTYIEQVGEFDVDSYYVYDGGEGSRYFAKNDDRFDMSNRAYMNYPLFGIKAFDESLIKSATFTCETEGDEMTFTITNNGATVTTTAVKEDDSIKTVTISSGSTVYVYTFEYGTAELSVPDLTDFEDQTATETDD